MPETTPDNVAVLPDAAFILESEAIVMVPDNVPDAEKYNAPFVADVPLIVSGSAELSVPSPANSSVAPLVTVVDERVPAFSPRPVLLETFNVPADTDVLPVYVFAADNVNVPEPDFVNVPVLVAIGSATVTAPVFASKVKS